MPLVALLKAGSAAAQAFAAKALGNVAAYDIEEGQNAVVDAGAVPTLLILLSVGKAQTPAAFALAQLARGNSVVQAVIASLGGIAPLLSLLNGRSLEAQIEAAAALAELARDNAETQDAIAAAGGICPLLALLASRSSIVQWKGMAALAQLARSNKQNQDTIAGEMGGLKPLIALLDSIGNPPDVQAYAAFALMEITKSNSVNQKMVVELGGIEQLAVLMRQSMHEEVKAEAAGTLWALSEQPEIKEAIAAANTMQPIVDLLGSGHSRAREHAANALSSLARDSTTNQEQITQMLIELLGSGSEEAQQRAADALWSLVNENPGAHETIAGAGNPTSLVALLKSGIPSSKDYATWSLSLSISPETRGIVSDAGGLPPLIERLADERTIIQDQAAAAVAKLSFDSPENCTTITSLGGITPLIKLLGAENSPPAVLQSSSNALANLAFEPTARDEIVAQGGVPMLVNLLKGEGASVKSFSSTALARLATDHEATQSTIHEAGAIPPLVAMLDGEEGEEAQQEAAGALLALADHKINRLAITEADGIGWLVSLLGCSNPVARAHAEGALVRLSIETENRMLIIEKLVDMLRNMDTSTGGLAVEQAAAALANLARESEENRNAIVGADGIPPILALLDSQSNKAKENAVSAITELCMKSKTQAANQDAIANDGGIPKLVNVMATFASGNSSKDPATIHLCTLAASAMKQLAKGNEANQNAMAEAGAITPLVLMLSAAAPQMQANAAGALANLARNHRANQLAIAKTGAISPLCTLLREGSEEAKDRAASAIWSLATDNGPNKETIAKLGAIDPLLGLVHMGTTEQSQEYVAGAITALSQKHPDNRNATAKRLVSYLTAPGTKLGNRAQRFLMTTSAFASDSTANQMSIAKVAGIAPVIVWLQTGNQEAQAAAAHCVLSLATENPMTQVAVAKAGGVPPLIGLIRKSSPQGQDFAARALWHLASSEENQPAIVESGAIKPLVAMLLAEWPHAAELASIVLVRLMRGNSYVSVRVADQGGIVPLVRLLSDGSIGAQQQAASVLAELAFLPELRDQVADAGAVKKLISLLCSLTMGTPERAARVLANLALSTQDTAAAGAGVDGAEQRRAMILAGGGVGRLISMLDGSNLPAGGQSQMVKGIGLPIPSQILGGREQAAATLADLAIDNSEMQDAIIEQDSVPHLLALIRGGSALGQEHAARAIRNLVTRYPMEPALIANQQVIVQCGAIPDLVQLTKTGSNSAQEVAAAAISELASGAVFEREMKEAAEKEAKPEAGGAKAASPSIPVVSPVPSDAVSSGMSSPTAAQNPRASSRSPSPPATRPSGSPTATRPGDGDRSNQAEADRLMLISEAGGITPLITMLSADNQFARENAAGALMHLALDPQNAIAIAKASGIQPLVTLLDDGTEQAHKHTAEALSRLSNKNVENQTQAAKHLVNLLSAESVGAQCRTARVLSRLAATNKGAPVIIVNAGAISPLVTLLANGALEVKIAVADALKNLSLHSPETQLAIATGLVALLGNHSIETQEHVTNLLLTLTSNKDNCSAVSRTAAIPRLATQLKNGSHKTQELSAAVLARLAAASDENVVLIAESSSMRPLMSLLSSVSSLAQSHIASILSHLARISTSNKTFIVAEGGVAPLVAILGADEATETSPVKVASVSKWKKAALANVPNPTNSSISPVQDLGLTLTLAKAEAAGALLYLSEGQPLTQKSIAEAGALVLIVQLLDSTNDHARKKAAGAIKALSCDSTENQDAFERSSGVTKLVDLLDSSVSDDVHAHVAAAIAALCTGNLNNQNKIASAHGIEPLVAILESDASATAKEETAHALWALTTNNFQNQVRIAEAGGIAPLVSVLGLGSVGQEIAGGALAALALDNSSNEKAIAKLIVSLLGSEEQGESATAARAIARLARETAANQVAIADAGGVSLLVKLLGTEVVVGQDKVLAEIAANLRKEMAAAIWSMAAKNPDNQASIATAGAIPILVSMLGGIVIGDSHRVVAGALWSMAGNPGHTANQLAIAQAGGIPSLVKLLKQGPPMVQETVAGAIWVVAEAYDNRIAIAEAGGIPMLVSLLDGESEASKDHSAGALLNLVKENEENQREVAEGVVDLLQRGSSSGQEHAALLLRNLAEDPENRYSIAKAGAVPCLVKQLENGTPKAMEMAAKCLALIALKSAQHRASVTNELVMLLGSNDEAIRQRASEALGGMAAEERPGQKKRILASGASEVERVVNLLKDGIRDDRIEAQEYALLSLSSVADPISRETIVSAGGIQALIDSLGGGKLSAVAQEHAATVLSSLAASAVNAISVKEAGGIEPLVHLLSSGIKDAKRSAALALAQLAHHAGAGSEIAEAGGIRSFVIWLEDPNQGPPEVAARALSEIALDNPDTQAQVAEEGAIWPLIEIVRGWQRAKDAVAGLPGNLSSRATSVIAALKLAIVAVGTLATLAKDNVVNQIMIAEEGGISPLLQLLQDKTGSAHENATKALWHLAHQEDNQLAIPACGGVAPLVKLLTTGNEMTQQYSAAAIRALTKDNLENQIALTSAGAIHPLAMLLGSSSKEMQEHAVGALLYLASNAKVSRNAVVERLVAMLHVRNAAAQMKAAKALAVLAGRSSDNRKAITAAHAIVPLVNLLGDGRRVKSSTPQERAAAVLADLARLSENKIAIFAAGSAEPLVNMLSSKSAKAAANAACCLWHLAAAGENKMGIAKAGAILPLVELLAKDYPNAQKFAMGALFQLAVMDEHRAAMVLAGIIPLIAGLLTSEVDDVREHAVAVLANLALSQGGKGNKKAIAKAGAIQPLVELLSDGSINIQKHAACALWSLCAGKDGIYDKQVVELGGVPPLVKMLLMNHPDTCGFTAACLSCLSSDKEAKRGIIEAGAADPLLALVHGPSGWLRTQAVEILKLLGIPFSEPVEASPRWIGSPREKLEDSSGGAMRTVPLKAIKELPVRKERFVDPNRENPKVGTLHAGDLAYILERREVVPGIWRALVAVEVGGEARGWVTAARGGVDFLVPDNSNKVSINRQFKFHFWPHQMKTTTVDCVHFK